MVSGYGAIADARAFNSAARGAWELRRTLVEAVCTTDDAAARRTER
jgi:hypothetical protein